MVLLEKNLVDTDHTPPRTATKVVDTGKTHAATTLLPHFEDDEDDRQDQFTDAHAQAYIRSLEDRMARRDRTLDALREEMQLIATAIRLGQLKLPRSPSPSKREGVERRCSVKDRLGSEDGHQEQPTQSVFERLRYNNPPPVTSSCVAHSHLSETASHQTTIDRQLERRHVRRDRVGREYNGARHYSKGD